MRKKKYFVEGEAKDSNGVLRKIVIVGVLTQEKTQEVQERIVYIPTNMKNDDKIVEGVLTFPRKQTKRRLKYSFAICHPDDNYDVEIGKKIAEKRIDNNPLGELETKYVTTLCEDQVIHILQGELQYIINNIEKFIEKI